MARRVQAGWPSAVSRYSSATTTAGCWGGQALERPGRPRRRYWAGWLQNPPQDLARPPHPHRPRHPADGEWGPAASGGRPDRGQRGLRGARANGLAQLVLFAETAAGALFEHGQATGDAAARAGAALDDAERGAGPPPPAAVDRDRVRRTPGRPAAQTADGVDGLGPRPAGAGGGRVRLPRRSAATEPCSSTSRPAGSWTYWPTTPPSPSRPGRPSISAPRSRACDLARAFAQLVSHQSGYLLLEWIRKPGLNAPKPIKGFAGFLYQHLGAITAGLTLPWGSAAIEGHMNRVKTLKRAMYGRASRELVRSPILTKLEGQTRTTCHPPGCRHGTQTQRLVRGPSPGWGPASPLCSPRPKPSPRRPRGGASGRECRTQPWAPRTCRCSMERPGRSTVPTSGGLVLRPGCSSGRVGFSSSPGVKIDCQWCVRR